MIPKPAPSGSPAFGKAGSVQAHVPLDKALDCEAFGRKRNWQGIADQFFTECEADAIRQANSEMIECAFLLHWTLKEAFVKANEISIFGALNHLIVRSSTEVQLKGCGREHWQAWHTAVGNCVLGVCFQDEGIVTPVLLECTDLLSGTFTTCEDITTINFLVTN
ncbi:MAG: 4-phosphopantetheinyl transferase family protein [Haliea sp.]|nr:4-phosphopantetheinyl transferase family protein [Haliea sp.]